jgi:calcineurin-like phosphoesterase family protein
MAQPRTWHISDTHVRHERCAVTWRGFASADEHDRQILANCQAMIAPRDIVYHHGDCGMSGGQDAILEVMAQIPGRRHLIAGNHDSVHPMNKGARGRQARWLEVFDSVHVLDERRIERQHVLMSHMPFRGDHTEEDRHRRWRPRDEGDWLLCGHVHAEWLMDGRQVNVGVDQWGMAPVPEDILVPVLTGARPPGELHAIRDEWLASAGLPAAA